ncbi:hypothetical protein ACLMJK_008723 [Lecanora helva]
MDTRNRALRVHRFRKRYYPMDIYWDGYPAALGKRIVDEIPAAPEAYRIWLSSLRATSAQRDESYEKFLTFLPGNVNKRPLGRVVSEDDDPKNEDLEYPLQPPDWMGEVYPSFFPPVSSTFIEYVYTVDLDNEVFTVNNSAHFALAKMPHIDWMKALTRSGSFSTYFVLPGVIPQEAMVDLVVPRDDGTLGNDSLYEDQNHIAKEDAHFTSEHSRFRRALVKPKSIESLPWQVRHVPLLHMLYFLFLSVMKVDAIGAVLLQLTTSELPFRELAFAILCLAAGGKNVTTIPIPLLVHAGSFGFIKGKTKKISTSKFFSCLGRGAHLQDQTPGAAPQEPVYWLEGVLVILSTQLFREGAVEESVTRVERYCQAKCPDAIVDAVVMSVEHVILVRYTGAVATHEAEVQHTGLLPLIDIPEHLAMRATDRYTEAYLSKCANQEDEKFQKRQKRNQRQAYESMLDSCGIKMSFRDSDSDDEETGDDEDVEELLHPTQVDGSIFSTFYALQQVFSATAHRRLAPNRQGCFPTEIYQCILSFVVDAETRNSCLHTSHILRGICLENYLFCEADGSVLRSFKACDSGLYEGRAPKGWRIHNSETGKENRMLIEEAGCGLLRKENDNAYAVLVGTGYGRKALLPEAAIRFAPCSE